jgi:hypothetical protein
MARLPNLHESGHKYLASCYLKKLGLNNDLNLEASSLDDLFQLYQKLKLKDHLTLTHPRMNECFA